MVGDCLIHGPGRFQGEVAGGFGHCAGLPRPDPTRAEQRPQAGVAVAQVERVGHLERRRRGGGVLQQAELGGGELGHLRGPRTSVGTEPVPTPPVGGDGTVQVGPVGGEQHQPGLTLDHRLVAGRDQGGGLAGVHHHLGIEHVFDTTNTH